MTERWTTVEQISAARDRYEARLGWRRPAAWGLLHDGADGGIIVDRANAGDGLLSAAILATVTGWSDGSWSQRITADELDQAIALLAPAEACSEMEHPNLRVWRYVREEIGADGSAVVVFVAGDGLAGEFEDPYVAALVEEIRRCRAAS